jgi:hypothetical protein
MDLMAELAIRRPKPSERKFLDARLADRTLSAFVLDRYRIVDALLRGYNHSKEPPDPEFDFHRVLV